ncbi:IclR family transcriptional regulator [Diaphorobacter sp. JS3051]|uniref:IclR family transcriptional regulator n=1 Tax=Diaphorobacter sp. JS3051 TaxID=2792224 RepID=UPI0018C9DE12|nr:IclR family transcriptional regulator [Diaphorobacter sp. JS3051]QPN29490.1 IclR family transcriptional regulator [Diaphorobacter sp. JS3051]
MPAPQDTDERQHSGIQVIARMSRIMRALSTHSQLSGMSLAAIAAEVELPRSTVQRIINALVAENIVEPAGPTGFRMGPALGQMLYTAQSDVVPVLKPHVQQLSAKLQETVCLARLQMHKLHIVDAVVGEQVLRVVPHLGIMPPLEITAAGKVLLARLDEASLQAWIQQELGDRPQQAAALRQTLDTVRQQGYALDDGQIIPGVSAIAVAINTYRGAYAMMVLAPSVRMQAQLELFKQELFSLRTNLEKLLNSPTGVR